MIAQRHNDLLTFDAVTLAYLLQIDVDTLVAIVPESERAHGPSRVAITAAAAFSLAATQRRS